MNNYSKKHAEVNYHIFELKNGLLLRPQDDFCQNIFSAYGYKTMEIAQGEIVKYANRTDRNHGFFVLPEIRIIEEEIVK